MRQRNKIMIDKLASQRHLTMKVRDESRQLLHIVEQQQLLDCSVQHYMQWVVPNQIRDAVQRMDPGLDLQVYGICQDKEIETKSEVPETNQQEDVQKDGKDTEMKEITGYKHQEAYYELVEWAEHHEEGIIYYLLKTQNVRVYKVDEVLVLEYLINGVGEQIEKNDDETFHEANKRLLIKISQKYQVFFEDKYENGKRYIMGAAEIRQKQGEDDTSKYVVDDPRHFQNCNCIKKEMTKRDKKKILPYCSCLRKWAQQQPPAMRQYIRRNAARIVLRDQDLYISYDFHGQIFEEKKDQNENLGETQKRLLMRMFTNIQSDYRIEEMLMNQNQNVHKSKLYWEHAGEQLDVKVFTENVLLISFEMEKVFRIMIKEKFQSRFLPDYIGKMKNFRQHFMSQLKEKKIQNKNIAQSSTQLKILMDKMIDHMKYVKYTSLCYRDVTMMYMYILLVRDEITCLRVVLGCN